LPTPADVISLRLARTFTLRTAIYLVAALTSAAVLAALITFVPAWIGAPHRHTQTKPTLVRNTAGNVAVAADADGFRKPADPLESALFSPVALQDDAFALTSDAAPAATSTAKRAAFLFESPFARARGLLFAAEPVGSDLLRQSLVFAPDVDSGRQIADLLRDSLPPERTLADNSAATIPVPRTRPREHQPMQAHIARAAVVTTTAKDSGGTSLVALSGPITFLKNLLHLGQSPDVEEPAAEAGARTAVYDIEAHVVYLPNGEKLEAHSGFGNLLDDARHVDAKDRGPTPPNVYRLSLRESLFHGVQAIRLEPVGNGNMYGRVGMLAHPYMLGPNGQSNGCVSVQDYPKFLHAFLRGDIDRLVVVSHGGATVASTAHAHAS
jgi:Tlde1 domain